jgi:CubicO group peptidase (beta-lactamase class C family)
MILGAAALSLAQLSSSAADLPDTAPGTIAAKLFEAINGADPKAPERFAAEFIIDEPWQMMTREKYRTMLTKLREQSGDLTAERVLMSDHRNLRLMIASAKAGKRVGLEIVLPPHETNRAALIWIHHFPGKGADPLPQQKLDEPAQIAAIEKYLEDSARLGLHSGAALIAQGDRILHHRAYGYAHSGDKTPNATRMQYGTASVGKMFTSVAIAQLHQAGKLSYTDTISKFFPDYPNKTAASKVEIRHLLEHSGGIGDPFDSPKLTNSPNYKMQSDWFETFAEKPLAFEPGARHEYSNGGYIVLAAIVEKVSGQKFTQYLKKHIFEPAGMQHTGLTTACEKLPVSVGHAITVANDPLGLNGPQPKKSSEVAEDGAGMGGWTSTAEDLFKFTRALRTHKLLDQAHTSDITSGKINFIPPPMNVRYCYGFYEMPIAGDRLVGHSGGGGDLGIGAEVEMLWNTDYTIIILSNAGIEEARRATHTIARFLASQASQN